MTKMFSGVHVTLMMMASGAAGFGKRILWFIGEWIAVILAYIALWVMFFVVAPIVCPLHVINWIAKRFFNVDKLIKFV